MASRGIFFFAGGFFLRSSCLFSWTFVILSGVIGAVDNSDQFQPPKSPTTCGSRPAHCPPRASQSNFSMPWGCPQTTCLTNYTYRYDNNSGEKSRLRANLSSSIYYHNSSWRCAQVLNLTWTVKLNDSDLPVIGFRLQYNRLMPSRLANETIDTLFSLKQGHKMPIDKNGNTMFYYDCVRLSIASKYRFQLFSRHQSPDNLSERLERPIGAMYFRTDCDIYPEGHYKPNREYKGFMNVSALDRDCSILAHFSPFSDSFGIKGYDVQLLSNGKIIDEVKNLSFTCKTVEPVPLKTVGAGSYMLKIIPVGGRCPCSDCIACRGSNKTVNISNTNYECLTTTVSTSATSTTTSTTTNMFTLSTSDPVPEPAQFYGSDGIPMATESAFNSKNQAVIIAAVIISSVVVIAVIVLGLKSRNRRDEMPVSTEEKDVSGGDLTRQPVVLIYASDNCFHSKVVQCLATYLQIHCYCDVRFDQWFQTKISEVSALDWIILQLKSVKNVVIINSEAGFRQYKTEGAYEKIFHETPLEDMFLPAVMELRNDYYLKPKSRKLFQVAFPYTDLKFFLSDFHSGMKYQLMTHIDDLVLNIHGLSKHGRRGKTSMAGINHKDYIESPEGRALEKAIREAVEYFKQNPSWFSNTYRVKQRENQHRVCSPVDKDLALQNSSFDKLDSLPENDSGFCMSTENQTNMFKAPDDDDSSSVSSANIELQQVILNKEFDCALGFNRLREHDF